MKIKYFFPFLLAALAMVVVGCDDDDDVAQLGDLRVSQSFVSLEKTGSSASITLTAAADWTFEADDIPSWLTVSPTSGGAGQTVINFSAPETLEGRNASLRIVSGSLVQEVNVIQGKTVATLATCKEVIDGADGKTYKVKGHIVSIRNTKYGNIDIADETGQIYLYGTLDKDGKEANNPVASWGLEVGDVITVVGPKTTYKDVVELVNVEVVDIEKSLAKILSQADTLKKEGGVLEVKVAYKGFALAPSVDEAYQEWIHFAGMDIWQGKETAVEPNPADTAIVRFNISANDAGERAGVINFSTTKDGSTTKLSYTFVQQGTISEVTVGDFLAAEVGDAQYRLTGIVSNLYYYKENVSGFYIKDHTGEVLVYQPNGFTGTEAKVGDVVTVSGKRGVYKETPQLVSGALEAVKYAVTEISIADFVNVEDSNEKYYLLSGTIRQTSEDEKALGAKDDVTQYGNFYLVDAAGNAVYVYGVTKGWGGAKGQFGELGLTYGDKLTIVAYKSTYKGLIEAVGMYLSSEKAAQ